MKIHKKKIVLLILIAYIIVCFLMRLKEREGEASNEKCMVYYIVNTDGMKGLGHSIILLVDINGVGTLLSFNGMQRSLGESLLGKAGIGKMSLEQMDSNTIKLFLETGDLNLDSDQLQDNYDWALYKHISKRHYNTILENAEIYIKIGVEYEELYAKYTNSTSFKMKESYQKKMENLEIDNKVYLYHIYINNCDTVARKLISSVDRNMEYYNENTYYMTPNGNLKAFAKRTKSWGVLEIGSNTRKEVVLGFLNIF